MSAPRTGLGAVLPGDGPTGAALWTAVGGVRGVIESILPGLVFLIVFAFTKDVVWSVAGPIVLAIVFLVIRLVRRENVTSAVGGLLLVAISAGSAILTGRAENNFLPGFVINGIGVVVMLVSLVVRRPFLGIAAGFLLGSRSWREKPARRRSATAATWLWVGLFGIRLLVEVPLYLASAVEPLATARLLLGVPFYAFVLWLTWLLMRGPWSPAKPAEGAGDAAAGAETDAPDAEGDASHPARDIS